MAADWCLESLLIVCGGESPQRRYLYGHFCDLPKSCARYSAKIGDIFWVLQLLVVPTFVFQQIIPPSLPCSNISIN